MLIFLHFRLILTKYVLSSSVIVESVIGVIMYNELSYSLKQVVSLLVQVFVCPLLNMELFHSSCLQSRYQR